MYRNTPDKSGLTKIGDTYMKINRKIRIKLHRSAKPQPAVTTVLLTYDVSKNNSDIRGSRINCTFSGRNALIQ